MKSLLWRHCLIVAIAVVPETACAASSTAPSGRITMVPLITCQSDSVRALDGAQVDLFVKARLQPSGDPDLDELFDLTYVWRKDEMFWVERQRDRDTTIIPVSGPTNSMPEVHHPYFEEVDQGTREESEVGTYTVEIKPVLRSRPGRVIEFLGLEAGEPLYGFRSAGRPGTEEDVQSVTNTTFTIVWRDAERKEVGRVPVEMSGIGSLPIHLSVYSTGETNSTWGLTAEPVGSFTATSGAICGNSAMDRYKVLLPFDGPEVSQASPRYPNLTDDPRLLISTNLRSNAPGLDTVVRIKENFSPMSTLACNDDFGGTRRSHVETPYANPLRPGKTYRVGVFYRRATAGENPVIGVYWLYKP